MRILFFAITLMSFHAFAEDSGGRLYMSSQEALKKSPQVEAALKENRCINGGSRTWSITGLYNRPSIEGTEHIGVTSYGDVAVLKENRFLIIYECLSGPGTSMGYFGDITVEEAGVNCSSGEILAFNVFKSDSHALTFRSPRFTEGDSLCFNKGGVSVSESSRSEIKESSSSSSSITSSVSVTHQ